VRNYYSFSLASIIAIALASPALAQESPAPATVADREGVIAYTPADFAAARPNTALDMIQRLPGFTFDGGEQVRGFAGAAGNVLIDGQRPTIKTDSLSDTLSRITISQVERIEVIRGSVPGIDMQGRTVVANVIRKKADTFQQVLGVRSFLFAKTGKTIPGWNYTATRRVGEHQFEFGLNRGVSMDDSVGAGWRTTIDPTTGNLDLYENSRTEGDGFSHGIRGNYKGPQFGGTLSLNALVSADEFKNEQRFIAPIVSDKNYVRRSANKRGELGVNYVTTLMSDLEWETLGLFKLSSGTLDSTGRVADLSGGNPASSQLFQVDAEAGERIGRSVLRYKMSPELSFEGGGEIAYNYRDQDVALTINGAPIALDSSDVLVEELRGEVFGQASWRPSKEWSFEAGIRVERSKIEQSGDIQKSRSFTYPKPRLLASWSPNESDQLRIRIEREVGQLDFQQFASEVDLNSGLQSSGNSDLEPSKSWVYEAAYEKRFWEGAAAVLTLRHEDVSDVSDLYPRRVQVDTDNDGVLETIFVEGPGNIGDGTNDLVQFTLTLPLAKLGLEGGELKVDTMWQNSEVTDPLTGDKRRFSEQRPEKINVNFRQDLPELNLTFGLGWFGGWRESYYQGTAIENLKLRDFFNSFVEWKPEPGFTLRAELNNFDAYSFDIERRVYGGPRDVNPLSYIETERRNSQVLGLLSARWTFN